MVIESIEVDEITEGERVESKRRRGPRPESWEKSIRFKSGIGKEVLINTNENDT